jgi:hypothetical protein
MLEAERIPGPSAAEKIKLTNSVALVRERTLPTERPPRKLKKNLPSGQQHEEHFNKQYSL